MQRTSSVPLTVVMMSHDSVGLGHARRNRTLAYALARRLPALTGRPVQGLLIASHPGASQDQLPDGWDWLVLPGLTHSAEGLVSRSLSLPSHALVQVRSEIIRAAVQELKPDLFIVDRHPYGIQGELRATIAHLRQAGVPRVLGLRDVLDAPAVVQREWNRLGGAASVAADFSAVWIYGDASAYDARATGEVPEPLAEIAEMTGYLGNGRPEHDIPASSLDPATPYVQPFALTVVGGGSDGFELASRSVRAELPDGFEHLVIAGPQMPADHVDALMRMARPEVTVHRSSRDIPSLIALADAVICMGGYNTTAEVLATTTPALVVPRSSRRDEQPLRAAALAERGVVDTAAIDDLQPEHITRWIHLMAGRTIDRTTINLNGLARVPELAAGLLGA